MPRREDVRRPGGQPCSATDHVPLDPTKTTAVVCAGGYRSSAGSSVPLRRRFPNLLNVVGGTGAWIKAGYEAPAA
jgi:rhodanese-related sulfurtransferase